MTSDSLPPTVDTATDASAERRVLVFAPFGRDASLIVDLLHREGIAGLAFGDAAALRRAIGEGAGALLLAEEALRRDLDLLAAEIRRQPPWSELPVLVLTRPAGPTAFIESMQSRLGNVVLLDRPIRGATLASTARNALRARMRQYETRAHLLALEDADRRKDVFLATLAHELRNPLAPIRSAVEVFRLSADLPPRLRPLVEIVGRQTLQLVRLVDDLLEMSRVSRGVVAIRREAVLLETLVALAAESVEPMRAAAGHRLDVSLPPAPVWLDADPARVVQVLANLLNNAIKYTDRGGLIRVEAAAVPGRPPAEDAQVEIRVLDSGIGIDAALLPRVFDLFAQADSINRRAQGGLGIGLTLVRTLVEMHGGTVQAASAGIGHGSVFTVRLPQHGAPVAQPGSTRSSDAAHRSAPAVR
ncbi:MAG: ATP-binding protein [Lautropia sp.]